VAYEEEVDADGPFPKVVGNTRGAFCGMGIFGEAGDDVMGAEVAAGRTKGVSTMNVRASLRMRDCLLRT
jgi:hypothetical protein